MFARVACCFLLAAGAGFAVPMAMAQSRPLAPGVLTVIPPEPQYSETSTGPISLPEVVKGLPDLDWEPHFTAKSRTSFERAQSVILRREIWSLEFAFKPLRIIQVDVPQPSGKMQKKPIWYMVYRIRYLGGDLAPKGVEDEAGHIQYDAELTARESRYFFPRFLLESHDFSKVYQDRIIPAAKEPIQEREHRGRELLNTVEISSKPIGLSTPDDPAEVWGYVTWEDVDPRIDFLSVYVRGLTNAYQPVDRADAFQQGDPPGTGREIMAKTLRLNFWRPGDTQREPEDLVHFGVPYSADLERQAEILKAYGLQNRVDYLWEYRLH